MFIIETFDRTQIVLKQTCFFWWSPRNAAEGGWNATRGQDQKHLHLKGFFRRILHVQGGQCEELERVRSSPAWLACGGFALTVFPALPFSFVFIFHYYFSKILLHVGSMISGKQGHRIAVPLYVLVPSALHLSEVVTEPCPCVWASFVL